MGDSTSSQPVARSSPRPIAPFKALLTRMVPCLDSVHDETARRCWRPSLGSLKVCRIREVKGAGLPLGLQLHLWQAWQGRGREGAEIPLHQNDPLFFSCSKLEPKQVDKTPGDPQVSVRRMNTRCRGGMSMSHDHTQQHGQISSTVLNRNSRHQSTDCERDCLYDLQRSRTELRLYGSGRGSPGGGGTGRGYQRVSGCCCCSLS